MSRRILSVAAVILALSAFAGETAEPTVFYVSTKGNDAWSGTLDEPNDGKTDGPFASVAHARDAIRTTCRKAGKLEKPVNVLIRGGFYRLAEPLVFGPEDSGTEDCPITYEAYPDETPIISGGRRVNGWKKGKGKTWVCDIPEVASGNWYFREMYINGEFRSRARTPNEGFYRVDSADKETAKTAFKYVPGHIKKWKNPNDIEVVLFHSWDVSRLRIASMDETNHVVTFTGPSVWPFGRWDRHNRYYVENVEEELDMPGEWYLDRVTGRLTYWPMEGENMTTADVIAPVLEEIFRCEGRIREEPREYVRHLTFRGLTFSHAKPPYPPEGHAAGWGDFRAGHANIMEGAEHCSIERCTFRNIGRYALMLGKFSKYNRIVRNEVAENGAGGISIRGGSIEKGDKTTDETRFNIIANNHVHHCGRMYFSAIGISLVQGSDNVISHNHIHDIAYIGISSGSSSSHEKPLDARCKRNDISFNHIHDVMTAVNDGGGIYTYGKCPGTIIRNNLIHDVYGYSSMGHGIYPDEPSVGMIIVSNVAYRTSAGVLHLHIASDNVIRNNIFAFAKTRQLDDGGSRNNLFERNIVYGAPNFFFSHRWSAETAHMDYNLYRDLRKDVVFPSGKSLAEWQAAGQDRHSIIADPMFVDPENDDFSLKAGSPAFDLGFQPIDLSRVGIIEEDPPTPSPETVPRQKVWNIPNIIDNEGFLRGWLVCGPFPNYLPDDKKDYRRHEELCWGYAHDFLEERGGEQGIVPEEGMSHTGPLGKEYKWALHVTDTYRVNFDKMYDPDNENGVAYAASYIHSDSNRTTLFGVGSDDGIKVWVNHNLVHDNHVGRGVIVDDDTFTVNLKKGNNLILVKVDEDTGGWGFCLRETMTDKVKQADLSRMILTSDQYVYKPSESIHLRLPPFGPDRDYALKGKISIQELPSTRDVALYEGDLRHLNPFQAHALLPEGSTVPVYYAAKADVPGKDPNDQRMQTNFYIVP